NTTDSKTVTWKSSNTSVATVSNGKITAVAPGTATITATCGSKTATCAVTVKQPLSKITLNETSLTMSVGTSETLTVTYNPSNTTDSKTVTWKSSNTSVATVSNGKITAIAPGTATITATCGNKTATCTVTVKQPLSGISMSSTKLTLNVGESGTLTVIYNEANTTDSKAVTWKTSNNAIATVSNGKVTAVAPGTVTITATCGSNTATCTVTVNQPLKEITLSDNNIVLDIGETKSLSVSYHPSNTTDNKTLTWSSSNESVVVVSNGKVTAVGAGTATVTAVCGSQTAICTVKVNEAKIDVSISETKIDLEIGSNKTIELIYNAGSLPEGKTLRFKSSNPSVATVSDAGVVTAISSGTVTIIVETSDGEQVAACEVTVQKDDSENTQLPDTEMPGNSEPDTNEPESTETDSEGTDSTATENVDTPSPNNDVNTLLAVIAAICAIGVIGMFGVVIVMMKKRK
ncbi:MAG: Ig domain-containing protein, partial [Agathobacter sp.]